MNINLLEWDTKFFKKLIGRIDLGPNFDLKYLNQLNDFDIIYIFSPVMISIEAPLMDIKVTYSKSIEIHVSSLNNIVPFDIYKHDYDQLLELTYQSGHDSRFLKDDSFGPYQFKRLYKQWIENSINDLDTIVLIYLNQDIIEGFVTVKKDKSNAQIELIAVNPNNHGKGIGRNLINAVENNLPKGIRLFVATQETNVGACKFYENLGFSLVKKEYIYHHKKIS